MQQNDEGSEPPVHGTKLLRKFVAENHSNSLMKNDVEYSSVLKRNKQKILRSIQIIQVEDRGWLLVCLFVSKLPRRLHQCILTFKYFIDMSFHTQESPPPQPPPSSWVPTLSPPLNTVGSGAIHLHFHGSGFPTFNTKEGFCSLEK